MPVEIKKFRYCKRCVYPEVAATPITLDKDGICSGCRTYDEQKTINWKEREQWLGQLLNDNRSKTGKNYDCLIPVSGGKDSYWQTHIITKVYKMKPLLVTYGENNHTDVGMRNIQRMKEVFGVDYVHFTPNIETLKKLNRIGLKKMGDPNMQAHIGIFTYPMIMAVKFNIPLIIWGEHGFMNLGGMHSYKDCVEFTSKYRREHNLRGFDWHDFMDKEEGLTEQDLLWAQYPSDEEIERVGLRGIFISNYLGWNQAEHTRKMVETHGFEIYPLPFDRTYARDSNLNDIHDNGVHDYMKYIKWGYGRCTDHVSRDIRNGILTRDEGIDRIRQYDHVIPGDLTRWLYYVNMKRTEFDRIADTFRDKRVWTKDEYGNWHKYSIWQFEEDCKKGLWPNGDAPAKANRPHAHA